MLSRRVHGAGLDCRWQGRFFALIVADRHFMDGFDCRVFWVISSPCLSLEGGLATIVLEINVEDGGVMNETVDDRARHGGIRVNTAWRNDVSRKGGSACDKTVHRLPNTKNNYELQWSL